MSDAVASRMREDWNQRAQEDAHYYVAFGRRGQDLSEFIESGADVVRALEAEMKRLPPGNKRDRRALEIGCGPGRLMLPMSWNFGEVHGVDVSDEMIRRAFQTLRDVLNAFPRRNEGSNLAMFQDELFDFVYSYAVFQHIPSRDVVFEYLREARRVLKPGGILRCQVNGLPKTAREYTTWEGVRIGAEEIAEFAAANDMQLLALEGFSTQYMWTTMRKQPAGWYAGLSPREGATRIRTVRNAHSGEPAVPDRGRFAAVTLWVENLPEEADLNQLNLLVEGVPAPLTYIGPPMPGPVWQVNALLPGGVRTGWVPVDLEWLGRPLASGWVRVVPAGPSVPRVASITDGVDLMAGTRIHSGSLKIAMEEVRQPEEVVVEVDGAPAEGLEHFCTDPLNERYEFNVTLAPEVRAGRHEVTVRMGRRAVGPVPIDVVR
ncbi:MAG: methyltransferase domain-containing protein [Bryobacterales bacterium]|nr:methyltransferase domain-containing protein [Bryobacterales bacterium]